MSDDNAFAEAQFRTVKYRPEFPLKGFADLDAARQWAEMAKVPMAKPLECHRRGQLDPLVDLLRSLRCLGEHGLALGAGGEQFVDGAIGVRMQRPPHAGAAFARRPIDAGSREVLLLSLRGRLR